MKSWENIWCKSYACLHIELLTEVCLFRALVYIQRYVADLRSAWPVLVVCGVIAPFLLSVAWLLLVRYFVGVVAWITIVLFNVLMIAVTVFFYIKGVRLLLASSER